MKTQTRFKRLILRAVLRKVSPMVIRVLAVPDHLDPLDLRSFDEVFRALLGWEGLGFSVRCRFSLMSCVDWQAFDYQLARVRNKTVIILRYTGRTSKATELILFQN